MTSPPIPLNSSVGTTTETHASSRSPTRTCWVRTYTAAATAAAPRPATVDEPDCGNEHRPALVEPVRLKLLGPTDHVCPELAKWCGPAGRLQVLRCYRDDHPLLAVRSTVAAEGAKPLPLTRISWRPVA